MIVWTSSFHTKLPPEIARISIARWAPKGQRDLPTVRELTPGGWFRSVTVDEYASLYTIQLARLDPRAVVRRIEDLARGQPAALLCWERPRDAHFCHRGFVSAWLYDELKINIFEFGLADAGCGHLHPKLPAGCRMSPQPTLI